MSWIFVRFELLVVGFVKLLHSFCKWGVAVWVSPLVMFPMEDACSIVPGAWSMVCPFLRFDWDLLALVVAALLHPLDKCGVDL